MQAPSPSGLAWFQPTHEAQRCGHWRSRVSDFRRACLVWGAVAVKHQETEGEIQGIPTLGLKHSVPRDSAPSFTHRCIARSGRAVMSQGGLGVPSLKSHTLGEASEGP